MRYFFIAVFFLFTWQFQVKAQPEGISSDTILEFDGEYFMPWSDGIIETSLKVAPEVARVRPSQVNLLKKKVTLCASYFQSDSLFNPFNGLKVAIRSSILPMVSISGEAKWIPSEVETAIYATLAHDSLPAWNPEPDARVTVYFNDPRQLVGNPVINDIYVEPRESGLLFNWSELDRISVPNRIIAAKNNNLPFFEPVSREDFILTLINFFQTSIEKAEKKSSPTTTTTEANKTPERREIERLKFSNDLEKIRKMDPELAEKLMQAYLEAGLPAAENASHTPTPVDQLIVLNSWREAVRKLKAEMNAMTPMERRSQAWWSNNEERNVSGLTPPGYSGSRPLVRLNKNLIDTTRPTSSIQLIVAEWSMLPGSEFGETLGYNLAFEKLSQLSRQKKLWEQIYQLLDP